MKSLIQLSVTLVRVFALVAVLAFGSISSMIVFSQVAGGSANAAVVRSVNVVGNQRVDADTVRSYVTVKPGRNFNSFDTDESLQALFATGLFADVRISTRGNVLLVEVQENPTINLVLFEGNDKVTDDRLKFIVQSKSLGIFSQEKVDSDAERVREAVRRSGRVASTVEVRVDQLDSNRVNIIFQINEGGRTKIEDISFVGNNAFSDGRLSELITHNESNFLSWLKRDDLYDPDRLNADKDRLRTFYFNRGYADFRVISAVADYDAENNEYSIVITVDEGDLYRFGNISIDNALPSVDAERLQDTLQIQSGDVYSARDIEKTLVKMTEAIALDGFAFAEVTPRGERDYDRRTIDLTFFVDEGPRTYIERIDIRGNSRTRGYVIRREFDISEGDAYNRVLVNRAKRNIEALGFFENVNITTRPGSAPDRVVVVVAVKDKPTGEISFGGGFSTNGGPVATVSLGERNFLGRGQFLKVSASLGDGATAYELSFTEPYFLGHRISAGFDVSRQTTEDTSSNNAGFDSDTTLVRLRASAPITEYLKANVNYTYKLENIEPSAGAVSASAPIQDAIARSPFTTSSIGWGLTYSTLDSSQKPREGLFGVFSQDIAGVGGNAEYVRTTGRLVGYYLVSEDADIVLKGAVGAGHIFNFSNDTLRTTDHFFQGGETIKGFDTRGLGPRDPVTGDAIGGTTYANATAEVQFPIPALPRSFGIRGALFAEAGTLFDNDFSGGGFVANDNSSIRSSVGASIIWDSPFGPLRADFSHVLQRESFDREQVFRFGVSSTF